MSRVLLQELTGFQLVKKFPAIMEIEGPLLHLQVPTTCQCMAQDQSSPCLTSQLLISHLKIALPSVYGS